MDQSPRSLDPAAGTGRFAPSPTGHFHLGNLRTALLAWFYARSQGQRFLLRIEDLDPDRSEPGFETSQIGDLRAIGLDWDAEPIRQSIRGALYRATFAKLRRAGLAYRCFCSRREIAEAAQAPHEDGGERPYPGTCANLSPADARNRADAGEPHSWRMRADGAKASFTDRTHGELSAPVDDFVLVRRDGVASYHLAVVVDDDAQGVTEVVRGDDLLLPTTARHAFLYDVLSLPPPAWRHVPLLLDDDDRRMAKREGSNTRAGFLAAGGSDEGLLAFLIGSAGLDPDQVYALQNAQRSPASRASQ